MGAESSKPSNDVSQHVFSLDAPLRLSNGLVDSLQKNTQTDSARSKQLELQFQQRLTSELERVREQGTKDFTELSKTLADDAEKSNDASTEKPAPSGEKQKQNDLSNASVAKEIESLKKKLEARRKLEQADDRVTKAKDAVATCLRTNDRRPLDCWMEVENFKREVGRLERNFVEKTIR